MPGDNPSAHEEFFIIFFFGFIPGDLDGIFMGNLVEVNKMAWRFFRVDIYSFIGIYSIVSDFGEISFIEIIQGWRQSKYGISIYYFVGIETPCGEGYHYDYRQH